MAHRASWILTASACVSDERITLCELEWTLVWNVRGDPAQSAFAVEAERLLGVALPLEPNTTAHRAGAAALWVGPRSWLLVAETEAMRNDFDAARAALNVVGGALFDVSASYVAWKVSGPGAARVLNRSCPLDFHPRTFFAGSCAQSTLGHINALLYRPREAAEFIVVVACSFAVDAWRELCVSAETDGYRIGPRARFDRVIA